MSANRLLLVTLVGIALVAVSCGGKPSDGSVTNRPGAAATTCNVTTTGTVQADNSVSGNPRLGDVYQVQGTIVANYANDDSVAPATITVCPGNNACPPGAANSVTSGLFLVNAHVNGTNTYAANLAAGYLSPGVWQYGLWTYYLNFSDLLSNRCTYTGSFTVSAGWNPGDGFLRSYRNTPNLYTDGNGSAFWGTGWQWYSMYFRNNTPQYGYAEVPGHAFVNVSGTDVSWVSGTQFTTQTLPPNVYNQIYICPTLASCTYYGDVAINSATDLTLPSSGGTYSNVEAWLGFVRDFARGHPKHANGYRVSLGEAAQFYRQWGANIDRFSNANQYMPEIVGSWLGTGYNDYNYGTSGYSNNWGLPAVDLWFAAAHAAGIHIHMGGMNGETGNCPKHFCTTSEQSNLQHYWAMLAARYGAFVDLWEIQNEADPPQTWVDLVASVLNTGVNGIVNGLPADPYGHLFTVSEFPSGYGTYPSGYLTWLKLLLGRGSYGPGTATPDANLTAVAIPHSNGRVNGTSGYIYSALSGIKSGISQGGCPKIPWLITTLPHFQGEGPEGQGITPSSQSAQTPNDETNGNRIVDAAYVLNQCVNTEFIYPVDFLAIDSDSPRVTATWLDLTKGRRFLETFMRDLEVTAAPLSVTLGDGCASGACSYAALASSRRVRLILNSSTGNASTGVPNSVTKGTATLMVPTANMICQWQNPSTGQIISTLTPTSGSYTFTAPNFSVDVWLQCDPAHTLVRLNGLRGLP
ncbi:MAG: hypothetical protein ACLQOO_30350 [Terriglobia bacterium]